MKLLPWTLLIAASALVFGACSSSGSTGDSSCPGDPPVGQECCCGSCYPSMSCMCNDGSWDCHYTDACYMKTCPGQGGGGAGGSGGFGGSGGAGGAGGGGSCMPCATFFSTCFQPVIPDGCLGGASLCPGYGAQIEDVLTCICTACAVECEGSCQGSGSDADCAGCVDAASATGGACEAAFAACPNEA